MQRATHGRDIPKVTLGTQDPITFQLHLPHVPRSTARPVSPPFLRPQQRHTSPELPSVIEYNTWMGVAGLGVRAIPQLLRNPAPRAKAQDTHLGQVCKGSQIKLHLPQHPQQRSGLRVDNLSQAL